MHCNKEDHNNSHDKKHKAHGPLMLILCMIPITLIVLMRLFNIGNIDQFWIYLMFLICPLLHVFMILSMFKNKRSEQ